MVVSKITEPMNAHKHARDWLGISALQWRHYEHDGGLVNHVVIAMYDPWENVQ